MQFHANTVNVNTYVVKTFVIHISVRLLYKQMSKPANLLTPGIHPDVNVAWSSSRWIWVYRGIPLPLQYAARISGSLHLIIYIHRSHVHPLITLLNPLAHAKPTHQQYKVRSHILRQLLNTIEDNSDKRLFLCKLIKGGPIEAFQCRPIKKLFPFVNAQRELYETKINGSHATLQFCIIPLSCSRGRERCR